MGDLWDAEVEKKTAKGEEPSLKDVVMKFVRPRIFWGGVAKFLSDVAQVMSPLVLKYLLNYIYQSYYSNPDNLTGSNLPPQVFDAFNANYNLTGKGFVYPLT